MKKYLVEFIGTFFLVFTVAMASAFAGNLAPLAIGSALMIMVYAGGHISGAHYNPAVTTAVYIRGLINSKDALMYIIVQIIAAVIAALAGWWFTGHAPSVAPGPQYSRYMRLGAEMLGTFALAYVVLNSATHPKTSGNSFYGLAIGFTVMTMAFALGGVSGGAFNPAVGLGPNILQVIMGDRTGLNRIALYIIGPIVGGAIAGYTYKYINAE